MRFRYHKNSKKQIIGIIFYKCALSSFIQTGFFDRCIIKETPDDLLSKYNNWEIFTCIRNPLDRIKSVFKDKVIANPINRINRNDMTLQQCQKLICKANDLPLNLHSLNKLDFNTFCKNLHKIYLLDSHFLPFYTGCLTTDNKIVPNKIIKLEDLDIEYLNKYGIKLQKENNTSSINIDDIITQESIDIIKNLYKKDFELFYNN